MIPASIAGLRWEHDFDNQTTWRTQAVFDDKNINQPTGTTSAIGDSPSYNVMHQRHAARRPARPRGRPLCRALVQHRGAEQLHLERGARRQRHARARCRRSTTADITSTAGGRAREEVKLGPNWTGYVAGGVEYTTIAAVNTIFSFPGGATVPAFTPVQRDFLNTAPEAGLLYRLDDAWQFRSRVASGYGTPNIGQAHGHAGGRERQQFAACVADQCRHRSRSRLDPGPDREAERHRLLRVLPQ